MTARRDHDNGEDIAVATDDLGIFGFAKRTGQLLVPMAIIAGLFGIWLKAEISTVRVELKDAVAVHARETKSEMVTRLEFDLLKASLEDKQRAYVLVEQEQTRQIYKNTLYLEAIGFKLGIKRNTE